MLVPTFFTILQRTVVLILLLWCSTTQIQAASLSHMSTTANIASVNVITVSQSQEANAQAASPSTELQKNEPTTAPTLPDPFSQDTSVEDLESTSSPQRAAIFDAPKTTRAPVVISTANATMKKTSTYLRRNATIPQSTNATLFPPSVNGTFDSNQPLSDLPQMVPITSW